MRQAFGALVLALLVSACATQAPVEGSLAWQDHARQVVALRNWELRGKLAVRTEDQSDSGSLLWQQADEESTVHLSGPLGVGATTLRTNGEWLAIAKDGEVRTWDISTPEIMALNTGWNLPIRALPHWLKGVPAPSLTVEHSLLQSDLLVELTQDGWMLHIESYGRFEEYTLPTRLRIVRGDTSARVIIREWTTDPQQ